MHVESYPVAARYDANGEITSAQDWLGNRFCVGDKVIYCVARDPRGGKMALGRVVKMRQRPEPARGYYRGEGIEVLVKTIRTPDGSPQGSPQWIVPSNVTALSGLEDHAGDMFADEKPATLEPHHRAARTTGDSVSEARQTLLGRR